MSLHIYILHDYAILWCVHTFYILLPQSTFGIKQAHRRHDTVSNVHKGSDLLRPEPRLQA